MRSQLTCEEKVLYEGSITEEELWPLTPLNPLKTQTWMEYQLNPIKPLITTLKLICWHVLIVYIWKGNYQEQQEGLISLILKQEHNGQHKDPTNLINWRPVTLQCYGAKILAKCLSNQIKYSRGSII